MNKQKKKGAKPADKKSQKVKIAITYEWEVTQRQWQSNKDFHETLPENIKWKAHDDPTSMFYFLNELDKNPNVKVEVESL